MCKCNDATMDTYEAIRGLSRSLGLVLHMNQQIQKLQRFELNPEKKLESSRVRTNEDLQERERERERERLVRGSVRVNERQIGRAHV